MKYYAEIGAQIFLCVLFPRYTVRTVYKYLPEECFVASCEFFPGGDCLWQAHTDAHHISAADTNKWQPSILRIFWREEMFREKHK